MCYSQIQQCVLLCSMITSGGKRYSRAGLYFVSWIEKFYQREAKLCEWRKFPIWDFKYTFAVVSLHNVDLNLLILFYSYLLLAKLLFANYTGEARWLVKTSMSQNTPWNARFTQAWTTTVLSTLDMNLKSDCVQTNQGFVLGFNLQHSW